MKTRNKIFIGIAILIVAALAVALFIYTNSATPSSGLNDSSQMRYYNQNRDFIIETQDGFYYMNSIGFLYFYDFEKMQEVAVCNKANCKHLTWDETTPDEQKCDAYLGTNFIAGFINDNRLYVMPYNSDSEGDTVTIIRSDLDRSEQTSIAELESESISMLAVKNDTLYIANRKLIYDKEETGTPTPSGKSTVWLSAVNLKNGEVKELTERKTTYGATLNMIGAEDNILYLTYDYFDSEFDGTNYKQAGHHYELYTYDIDKAEYKKTPAQTGDDNLYFEYIQNAKAIAHPVMGSTSDNTYDILEVNIKSGEAKKIDTSLNIPPAYIDKSLVYQTKDGYFMYDIEKGEAKQIGNNVLSKFYAKASVGKYIYGSVSGEGDEMDKPAVISKEDFYNDKPDFTEIYFYAK